MTIRFRLGGQLARLDLTAIVGYYRRFGRHLRDQRGKLAAAAVCVAGLALTEILRPWPLKVLFDGLLTPVHNPDAVTAAMTALFPGEKTLIVAMSGAILVIALLGGGFGYLQTVLVGRIGQKLTTRIRAQLYGHIQRLSPDFHDERDLGDLITRLGGDVLLMRELLVNSAVLTLGRFGVILAILGVMLAMDWQLTLVAVSVAPLLLLALGRFSTEIKGAARKQRRREGALVQNMTERLAAIRLVQAFAREAHEAERFSKQNRSSASAGLRATKLEANLDRLVQVLLAVGTCLVVGYGVYRIREGAITPGDLLVFVAYLRALYRPLQKLANTTSRAAKAMASGERITAILDLEPAIRDAPDATEAPRLTGAIRFEDVSFTYKPVRRLVLDGLELDVRPGETVAITGPSGIGKSTLANLLLRFYDPLSGRIAVDGHDLRGLRLDSLRSQIAIVLQDSMLFAASIRENIAYGRLDASDADIEAAAKAAEAHGFIMGLPDGYDTVLGERGQTLSGGQRQRIAIARALVRDAPIVVLDEPMTGLDRASEAKVRTALERLMQGRTCILISHDPATLSMASRILELRAGKLVPALAAAPAKAVG